VTPATIEGVLNIPAPITMPTTIIAPSKTERTGRGAAPATAGDAGA
jgi:hypothetical protein